LHFLRWKSSGFTLLFQNIIIHHHRRSQYI
jgi:hypothetical protein